MYTEIKPKFGAGKSPAYLDSLSVKLTPVHKPTGLTASRKYSDLKPKKDHALLRGQIFIVLIFLLGQRTFLGQPADAPG